MQTSFCNSFRSMLACLSLTGALYCAPSWAATYTVVNSNDAGAGSLRQALLDANASPNVAPDKDVIEFTAGAQGTIEALSPLPALSSPVSLVGPGAEVLVIRGGYTDSRAIFYVDEDTTVEISGLTVTNGIGDGGVFNNGVLTMTNCVVRDNKTTFLTHGGGGIYSVGTLTLSGCTISGNTSDWDGGGIFNTVGTLTMTRCVVSNNESVNGSGGGLSNARGPVSVAGSTFAGNKAAYNGGAFSNINQGTLLVSGSTCSNNTAIYYGGAVYTEAKTLGVSTPTKFSQCTLSGNSAHFGGAAYIATGTLVSANCTIAGNSAVPLAADPDSEDAGGGVTVLGVFNVNHTLIALNSASSAPDVKGLVSSGGYNMVGKSDDSTGFTAPSDHLGTIAAPLDPKLGQLADNGGFTMTRALSFGSPAIDAGNPALNIALFPNDQRGEGYPRLVGSAIDIGAFEFGAGDNIAPAVTVTDPADGSTR